MADNLLYKQTWLELIFKDKNKVYGAYFLRQLYEKNVVVAVLFAASIFALAIAAPVLITHFMKEEEVVEEKRVIPKVTSYEAPPPDESKTPPPPPPPEPPKIEMAKFLPPVPKPDDQVVEEIKTIKELEETNVGAVDQEGVKDAFGAVEVTEEVKAVEIVKDEYDINDVEEIPTYPGGNPALFKLFGNNIKYPKQAMSREVQGTVTIAVTVGADGSISNIRVAKGLGYGLDDEALRLAKMMSNWIPAKMNGKSVKIGTMYIPIKFALDDSEE